MRNFLRLLLVLFAIVCCPLSVFAQLVSLNGTTESLTIVLSGAAATTEPTYNITWLTPTGAVTTAVGATTGATPVTALAGPDSANSRNIGAMSIYNGDTAAVTVTVNKKVSSTSYPLLKQSIPVGSTLVWNANGTIAISAPSVVANIGGTATTTGLTSSEQGNGVVQKTVFTFSNVSLTVADATVGVGSKIYDFPEGRIFILGATGSATFTTSSILANTLNASSSSRWGVGTVTQTSATLATTEQDILPVTTFTSSATISVANTATTAALASAAQFDGTATESSSQMVSEVVETGVQQKIKEQEATDATTGS